MDRMSANQVGRKQVGQRDKSNCNADPTKPSPTNPEHRGEHSPFEFIDQKWPGLILSCDVLDTGCYRKGVAWARQLCASEADPKGAGSWRTTIHVAGLQVGLVCVCVCVCVCDLFIYLLAMWHGGS